MEKSTGLHEISAGSNGRSVMKNIPPVHRLLAEPDIACLCEKFRRDDVVSAVRSVLSEWRQGLLSGHVLQEDEFSHAELVSKVRETLRHRQAPRLTKVINATGVALHTNLGRAPLATEAIATLQQLAAGYCNLEFSLDTGKRGSRYDHVEDLLCHLTGAEAALVVNNGAAAVLLALMALAQDGDVLVSRGELIEIGGSFRMPDVIAQSGARLVEVGATNKTALADYERAITARTRMILKSHPSNFRITGFTAQPERVELARLAEQNGLAYVEDLGSGTLVDLRRYGLPHEPTVQESVKAGTHVITFSGDKLLGGPQAGIIVGRAAAIAHMKKHPLLRALRIDKLSLAALEATLRLYESPTPPERLIPVLTMLATRQDEIRRRAKALARRLRPVSGVSCSLRDDMSLAGGGSLPETGLPTTLLKIQLDDLSADELTHRLRQQRPALIGRIVDDCFALDLRTVTLEEARLIPQVLQGVIG